jgi:hypothetical protein
MVGGFESVELWGLACRYVARIVERRSMRSLATVGRFIALAAAKHSVSSVAKR